LAKDLLISKWCDNTITMKKIKNFFRKLWSVLRLFKRNFVSLHRLIWGSGWKGFVIAAIVTIIILVGILAVSMEVTSRPKFCSTCHYMKPYYESWQNSSHRHITCTDCHFPPGLSNSIKGKFTALSMLVNYFTGVYKKSKPRAEISDVSCMRGGCHEARTLKSRVTFKEGIIFDHAPHLERLRRDKKLRCTSCHSQIVQGSHISVTESTCFLCHFKEVVPESPLNDCSECHQPPVKGERQGAATQYDHTMVVEKDIECQKCHGDMIIGDGAVPKNRCDYCHAELEKLSLYDDTEFMHKNHITDHKIECQQCHTEIQHKSVSRSELVKPDCRACHPDFHQAQLKLFAGTGGRGLPRHPSTMFESGLNCQGCHIFHQPVENFKEKGVTFLASAESCEPCHGKGYDRIIKNWKQQTDKKLAQLSRVVEFAQRAINRQKVNKNYNTARQKVEDALYNYQLVKFGNAIHNIAFASQLLEKAYLLARQGVELVDTSAKLPYFERANNLVPGECSNCHAGVERTEKKIFGWTFPHYKHLVTKGLSCGRCHSNVQQHGQLIIKRQDCMNCHHQDKQSDCKSCHQIQYSIYFSRLEFSTFEIPNPMAEDVSCLDCHQDDRDNIYRSDKKGCSNCHEAEYEELFEEWERTSLGLIEKLRDRVKREGLRRGDNAFDVLRLLEKDGSRGIHNPELYEKLVREVVNE
jgi:nitrate/TMAO reductase-like tetraheme cytochrome c subunit